MSDAIDCAEVVLFGVSLAYKESAHCRLEANYAHQQEVEMIPLVRHERHPVIVLVIASHVSVACDR